MPTATAHHPAPRTALSQPAGWDHLPNPVDVFSPDATPSPTAARAPVAPRVVRTLTALSLAQRLREDPRYLDTLTEDLAAATGGRVWLEREVRAGGTLGPWRVCVGPLAPEAAA